MPQVRKPRTRPRVEKSESTSNVTKPARHRGKTANDDKPTARKLWEAKDDVGYELTAQASELVPVAQYANVTVGPVAVTRTIVIHSTDPDDVKEAVKDALEEMQDVVEDVVSADRNIVLESVEAHNRREREEAAAKKK